MPLAHIALPASNLEKTTEFYTTILAPLGYTLFMKADTHVGFGGTCSGPDFWLYPCEELRKEKGEDWKKGGTHVAFQGKSKKMVEEWYKGALKAGATCNGPPGERLHYMKGYHAAYVIDLDGNNIECVYYQPLWLSAVQAAPYVAGTAVVAGVAWWLGKAY